MKKNEKGKPEAIKFGLGYDLRLVHSSEKEHVSAEYVKTINLLSRS